MEPQSYTSPGMMNFGYPPGVSVTDLVPDHMKPMIHPHWTKYPPVNPMWHYVLGVIYLFLGASAFFGKYKIQKIINTFASQRLVCQEKINHFSLKMYQI